MTPARRRGWPLLTIGAVLLAALLVGLSLGSSARAVPSPPAPAPSPSPARSPSPTSSLATAARLSAAAAQLPGQPLRPGILLRAGPGTPAGDAQVVRLRVGNRPRGYLLLPPLGWPTTEPAGLLVVLHQDAGSALAVADALGLDRLRRSGIALAYPAGIDGSWNAGDCCGIAKAERVDDVAFVNAVLDDAGSRLPIDPLRRGLLGYSGGGMLAYRVLCQSHPELAAAVEVSGSLESDCARVLQLPDLLSVHGALDGTVGLTKPVFVRHLRISPRTVASTLRMLAGRAGCGTRNIRDGGGTRLLRWPHCRGGSTVQAQIVQAAGHGWDDIGAADRVVPFLLARLAPTGRRTSTASPAAAAAS